jgi:hypothetical protein
LVKTVSKLEFAIASKVKGKNGGTRLITSIVVQEKTIFLLTIYDKSEKENLTDKELIELLEFIPE